MSLFEQYKSERGAEGRKASAARPSSSSLSSSPSASAASSSSPAGSLDAFARNHQRAKQAAFHQGKTTSMYGKAKVIAGGHKNQSSSSSSSYGLRKAQHLKAKTSPPTGAAGQQGKVRRSVAKPTLQLEQHLTVLRDFDLNSEFGPCVGITRMERWKRAQAFGLNPPLKIKQILEQHPGNDDYQQSLWYKDV
ncbi:polymerase [Salpingoeca rosetta]|uniref:Polymerase n=1 Tax=Salpingoeca rosetta (strain ATCC 50818 / BSB-021) TaxID=946362 RepID=F2ULI9_SALR5|nr:polymerase [Salpingoeca rosetta]EGD77988.1 polymerase [Salpingoeca rosetta]|eukprot:XP_004990050.1 polymerase [Salpingoeca rosetta]